MRSRLTAVPVGCALLGLSLVFGLANRGWTQGQLGTKDTVNRAYEKTSARRGELLSDPKILKLQQADKEVAHVAAQFYIYRITWTPGGDWNPHFIKVQHEFASDVNSIVAKTPSPAYMAAYSEALVECMKAVLDPKDGGQPPPVVVNTCMMMPSLGKLKQDNTTSFLAALVDNAKTDEIIRLYAIKGLKEALPVHIQDSTRDTLLPEKMLAARIGLDIKPVNALTKYIEQAKPAGNTLDQLAVFYYFRREAITALANAEAPAVAIVGRKPARVEGPVAPTLLKVLSNDTLQPPPRLQEKLEAAIGVCRMKYPSMPEYQPDVGIYLVGRTVVEFIDTYRNELGDLITKKIPQHAYRYESKRLDQALDDLVKNAGDAGGKAKEFRKLAGSVLNGMVSYEKGMAKYNAIDNGKFAEITAFVSKLKPKTTTLFKGHPALDVPVK